MSERWGYILMIKEKWWTRLCERNRAGKAMHAYIQGGVGRPKDTQLVLFYVTHPFKEIRGFGEFIERIVGGSSELWASHGHETCLTSYEEYEDIMRGRGKVTFVRFENLHEGSVPVPFDIISKILGIQRMPRRGRYINKEEAEELIALLR